MSLAEPLNPSRGRERAASSRPAVSKTAVRKAVFTAHLWVGIALSVWFVLLGLTGALLVFKPQVDAFLNPGLLHSRAAAAGAHQLSPDAALAGAQAAYPDAAFKRLAFPVGANGVYALRLGQEKKEHEVFVDAYSGAVLGERAKHDSLMEQVLDLHKALLLGKTGEQVNGIGALLLVGLIATGIYLWWPANPKQWPQRLRVKTNASSKRLLFDLHNAFGVYTLPVLLVIAATGAVFIYEKQVEKGVYALTGTAPPREKGDGYKKNPMAHPAGKARGAGERPTYGVTLASLVTASESAAPGTYLKHVDLPEKSGKPVRVHRERRNGLWVNNKMRVHLDPKTGALVKVEDERKDPLPKRILRWNGPLHEGRIGGPITQWLYLAIALIVPLGLTVTGIAKWLQTKRSRSKNRSRNAGPLRPNSSRS